MIWRKRFEIRISGLPKRNDQVFRKALARPGRDIRLVGGRELARDFLEADLVDELYLGVVPVLLREGIPLFPSGFPQRDFSLLENPDAAARRSARIQSSN